MGDVFDDCMDATVDALVGKEASVKVKRYGLLHLKDCDEWRMCEMAGSRGTHVLATDYDALLALARRMRAAIDVHRQYFECESMNMTAKVCKKILADSSWLEE